jgi:hypothetical protein
VASRFADRAGETGPVYLLPEIDVLGKPTVKEMEIFYAPFMDSLMKENDEIIAILVSSIKTSRRNR